MAELMKELNTNIDVQTQEKRVEQQMEGIKKKIMDQFERLKEYWKGDKPKVV